MIPHPEYPLSCHAFLERGQHRTRWTPRGVHPYAVRKLDRPVACDRIEDVEDLLHTGRGLIRVRRVGRSGNGCQQCCRL
ncbi:hypothetical protein BIU92_09040 [Curtobacterium sp. MCBA15_003]|nr:hypothetical protein BIU92_09040 [Curtobacterium sp. MCBA15_003]OII29924.1 hypothetical protein BIU94_09780 [Curtobacterium sp. MMLR14_006]